MLTYSGDGVRIEFETVGDGPPLVLLHGFFGDRTTWRSAGYVDLLSADFRLVLIDARGHGGSDAPHDAAAYRIDCQVGDVIAVLDELRISRAAFWGASLGATIGLHLLALHPERLTALVAGGAHGDRVVADPVAVEREVATYRTEGIGPFITWLERRGEVPSWMRDAMRAADPRALAALTGALANRDGVLEAIAATSVPVLLLAGSLDPGLTAIRRTAAKITNATLVEFPGLGHLDVFTHAAAGVPVAREFLGALA